MGFHCEYGLEGCDGEITDVRFITSVGLRAWIGLLIVSFLPLLSIPWVGGTGLILAALPGPALCFLAVGLRWPSVVDTERFQVRHGKLTVTGRLRTCEALLAGARVVRFSDGVYVNPALGDPVQLSWQFAKKQEIDELATALESAIAAPRPTDSLLDVPSSLEGLRGHEDSSRIQNE